MGTWIWPGVDVLIGNHSVLAKDPGRSIGGGATGLGMNRSEFGKTSTARGAFTGSAWSAKSGIPDGYRPPYTWVNPIKAGGLSARKAITGEGDAVAAIAGGKNAEASLAGAGDLSGVAQLIISMVAALTGSGTITSAAAVAYLQLAANLAGAGDLTGATGALASAAAALSGSGTATSTARATGALTSSITVSGDLLTSTNVGAAVWRTMIEAGYTAEQILRIIAAQAAGAATGLEGANPQFTGLDGTTLRIDGTYSAGTRTIDSLDGE